ncbi:hypothetical protein J4477_01860 [Candidatus Pacearchaeota archaeon]|nr:hypothetical protein [Candidatus Pacearchaeota archaeon]
MALKLKKQIKKKFFPVEVPILNTEINLFGGEIEDLNNRYVKLDLTNQLKGKAMEIKLKTSVENNKVSASPVQIQLLGYYVRRAVRKGTDYSEDSFITQIKDKRVKIKLLLVTRKRVTKKVLNGLRKSAKEEMIEYVKEKKFEDLLLEIINGKVQREINIKLKRIYPLSLCEIRFFGIDELKEHEIYEKQQKEAEEESQVNTEEEKPKLKKRVKKAEEE